MEASHFPQLADGTIYLDSAATTLKPLCVIETLSHFYRNEYATVHRSLYSASQRASERYHQSRLIVQKFLGAALPEEILFTRGTTHSLNLLARSFCEAFLKKEDAIIVSEVEHHSNVVPWQMAVQRHGGKLLFVRVDERGEIDLRHLAELLTLHRVKLISIAHISNITGRVQPIEAIIALGHAASAYVALDGAQAAAHRPIHFSVLDVDFYAFSSHKVYGPTGVGVLYGKKALLEEMPPYEGGGDMIQKVFQQESSYASLPYKFEAGTPAIAEVIGLGAALTFIQEQGWKNIVDHERKIREYAHRRLTQIGVRFIGESQSSILTFTLPGMHAFDAALLLDCKKIALRSGQLCSQLAMARFGIQEALRISFGIYTTYQDIDALVTALVSLPCEVMHG